MAALNNFYPVHNNLGKQIWVSVCDAEELRISDPDGVIYDSTVIPINQQSGDYTLQPTDIGKRVESIDSSPQTFTVPSDIGEPGNVIELSQMGAGTLTIAGAGVTVNTPSGTSAAAQYATMGLVKEPDGSWTLSGYTA